MKAVLKSLFSFEAVDGLERFQPVDPESFGIAIQAFIGSDEPDSASDSFDFVACTPVWLARQYAERQIGWNLSNAYPPHATRAYRDLSGWDQAPTITRYEDEVPLFGRGFVFMPRWDYERLRAVIEGLCGEIEGPTWGSVANQLSRWLSWEFDYKYDRAIKDGLPFP